MAKSARLESAAPEPEKASMPDVPVQSPEGRVGAETEHKAAENGAEAFQEKKKELDANVEAESRNFTQTIRSWWKRVNDMIDRFGNKVGRVVGNSEEIERLNARLEEAKTFYQQQAREIGSERVWTNYAKRRAVVIDKRQEQEARLRGSPVESLLKDFYTYEDQIGSVDAEVRQVIRDVRLDELKGELQVDYADGSSLRKYPNGRVLRTYPGGKVERLDAEEPVLLTQDMRNHVSDSVIANAIDDALDAEEPVLLTQDMRNPDSDDETANAIDNALDDQEGDSIDEGIAKERMETQHAAEKVVDSLVAEQAAEDAEWERTDRERVEVVTRFYEQAKNVLQGFSPDFSIELLQEPKLNAENRPYVAFSLRVAHAKEPLLNWTAEAELSSASARGLSVQEQADLLIEGLTEEYQHRMRKVMSDRRVNPLAPPDQSYPNLPKPKKESRPPGVPDSRKAKPPAPPQEPSPAEPPKGEPQATDKKEEAGEPKKPELAMEDDPRYRGLLEEKSLERLKTKDAAWFGRHHNGKVAPSGYLLDTKGVETVFLPSQNLGIDFEEIRKEAREAFERGEAPQGAYQSITFSRPPDQEPKQEALQPTPPTPEVRKPNPFSKETLEAVAAKIDELGRADNYNKIKPAELLRILRENGFDFDLETSSLDAFVKAYRRTQKEYNTRKIKKAKGKV